MFDIINDGDVIMCYLLRGCACLGSAVERLGCYWAITVVFGIDGLRAVLPCKGLHFQRS